MVPGGHGRDTVRVAVGVGSRQLPGAAPFELVDDDLDVACDANHIERIVTRILRWHRPRRRDLLNRLARRVTGPYGFQEVAVERGPFGQITPRHLGAVTGDDRVDVANRVVRLLQCVADVDAAPTIGSGKKRHALAEKDVAGVECP